MSAEKKYTEREMIAVRRQSFADGCQKMAEHWEENEGIRRAGIDLWDGEWGYGFDWGKAARERYPIPTRTVRRLREVTLDLPFGISYRFNPSTDTLEFEHEGKWAPTGGSAEWAIKHAEVIAALKKDPYETVEEEIA